MLDGTEQRRLIHNSSVLQLVQSTSSSRPARKLSPVSLYFIPNMTLAHMLTMAVLSMFWPWIAIPLLVLIVWQKVLSKRHRHNERPQRQQQEQRLAILRGLQSTMDPFLAAQVYNRGASTLCRLPDKLLLLVVRQLDRDAVALFCLGRVSRAFRRVVHGPSVWTQMPLPDSLGFAEKMRITWPLFPGQKAQLRRLLDADGMCDACKHTGWWEDKLGDYYSNPKVLSHCPFFWRSNWHIHCYGCPCHHRLGAFSRQSSLPEEGDWCLGRSGTVRLCEHVSIPWMAVEQHIIAWRRDRPDRDAGDGGDTKETGDTDESNGTEVDTEESNHDDTEESDSTDVAYDSGSSDNTHNRHDLDALVAECRHPMHNTSCNPREAPTWPRARLQNVDNHKKQNFVLLVLEWAPHSGVGAFKPTPPDRDDRPAAGELRALFQRYRRPGQPAEELVPRYPSGPLPEMACFDPDSCGCLRYDVGDQGGSGNDEEKEQRGTPDAGNGAPPLLLQPPRLFRSNCHPGRPRGFVPAGGARRHRFYSSHCYWRGMDRGGEPSQCVWMRQHWPRVGEDSEGSVKDSEGSVKGPRPCLVTTYRRAVVVCDKFSSQWTYWIHPRAALPPTHDWFHAMDPDSYVQSRGAGPRCKDRACINYYKRPKTVECNPTEADLHGACTH